VTQTRHTGAPAPRSNEAGGELPVSSAGLQQTWPPFFNGQPGNPVRVILADDDPVFTCLIEQELPADLRIDLLGCARSVAEARRLIDRQPMDVVLIDLNLPDGTGFEVISYLKAKRPMAEAVVVTASEDLEHALHAFALGATGYVVKGCWFCSFAGTILQVANGGAALAPGVARQLLKRLHHQQADAAGRPAAVPAHEKLSEREREILRYVSAGGTSSDIGKRLAISEQTVNTHIKNAYRKLNVRTRAQAVTRATEWGLL